MHSAFDHLRKGDVGLSKAYGNLQKKALTRNPIQIHLLTFTGIMMSPSAYPSRASKNLKSNYLTLTLNPWNFISFEAILKLGSTIWEPPA
jgi:hypothetical protein